MPTPSPGELRRLRLATALGSRLFGVIYVLDEPSAGLRSEIGRTHNCMRVYAPLPSSP